MVTGGTLVGNYKSRTEPAIGIKLVRAGYAVTVVVLGLMGCFLVFLWLRLKYLTTQSTKVSHCYIFGANLS